MKGLFFVYSVFNLPSDYFYPTVLLPSHAVSLCSASCGKTIFHKAEGGFFTLIRAYAFLWHRLLESFFSGGARQHRLSCLQF